MGLEVANGDDNEYPPRPLSSKPLPRGREVTSPAPKARGGSSPECVPRWTRN